MLSGDRPSSHRLTTLLVAKPFLEISYIADIESVALRARLK